MTQAEALEILKTGVNAFLTGEPGSGKTFVINEYVRFLRERGVEPSITASTGIAATHVGGATIHSWSGIGIKNRLSQYDIDAIGSREKTAKRIIDAKVLIIDEISMLDASTLESVERVLSALRQTIGEAHAFGGLQIIFVGDFFQLPPVSKREKAAFAFSSEAWRAANPVVCYLSEQHRQEDPDLLDLLQAMRSGQVREAHRARLSARISAAPKREVATRLYTHNEDVDRINKAELEKLSSKARVFQMQSRGAKALVESLKASCLSPEALTLKEGAAVMFTRNNLEAGYVNGTLGTITGFSDGGVPLVKTRAGKTLYAEPADWTVQDGNKVLAKLTQVPLRLAWAITVHKSQGMSLDAAIVDLGAAFEYGQGYVAISRLRSLGGLFLERLGDRALLMHPEVVAKDREFRKRSDMARERFAALTDDARNTLHGNFLRAIGAKEPSEVKTPEPPAQNKLEKLRETFPNAGRPWNKEDDEVLKKMFVDDVPQKEIATHFGRKPSAIHARLGLLGLVEDFWVERRKKAKEKKV